MSLAWIPRGILKRLQNLYYRFLWNCKQLGRIFAWAKWDLLSFPKKWGGWGIKKLEDFSSALVTKLGWKLITTNSPWNKVASSKYIDPLSSMDWLRKTSWKKIRISNIWKAVLKSLSLIRDGLNWRIHAGTYVHIGLDPWIGCGNAHLLPGGLKHHLIESGITHSSHIADMERSTFLHQACKSAHSLLIPHQWHHHWADYTVALIESCIRTLEGEDEIIWALTKNGQYSPKGGHLHLANIHKQQQIDIWWKGMWKLKAPLRTRLLMWSILKYKIPTRDSLIKRGQHWPF